MKILGTTLSPLKSLMPLSRTISQKILALSDVTRLAWISFDGTRENGLHIPVTQKKNDLRRHWTNDSTLMLFISGFTVGLYTIHKICGIIQYKAMADHLLKNPRKQR